MVYYVKLPIVLIDVLDSCALIVSFFNDPLIYTKSYLLHILHLNWHQKNYRHGDVTADLQEFIRLISPVFVFDMKPYSYIQLSKSPLNMV